jgi:valyl-tRNA synthetase
MIVFLHILDDEEAALFESQRGVITTLTKGCKSVEVVRDVSKIPSGCGSTVLTSTISLHILVRVSFFLFFLSGDELTTHFFFRA